MKKFLSFILTLFMVLGMSFTTFAATDVNASGTAESKVVKTVDSEFSVLIPKKIELTSEKADFTVQAKGNIAAIETLEVTADETVDMKRAGDDTYDDMDASVSLEGCTWNDTTLTSEYTSHEGSVTFEETKAGEYSGTGTFYINLKSTKIPVTSVDADGNNLNASAYRIVGEEETILLDSLVASNLIASVEDVDALIEIESDDFEGMAETTFDVSKIAKEGDTVVILHYDETTESWEYISTETVDTDLEVNADFSSYSPVAFVVIPAGETKEAFAVYSEDDNSLNFYKRKVVPAVGETFEGKTVTAVYTGVETGSDTPWHEYQSNITKVQVVDKISPTSTAYWFFMFENCSRFELENLDTSNVTNMDSMFDSAGYNVQSFTITGLDSWDISNVENMDSMFRVVGCYAEIFSIGDLSNWNTSSVTNMNEMFRESGFSASWSLDCSNWNVDKVIGYTDFNFGVESKVTAPTWVN